jgi:hypothetical protein
MNRSVPLLSITLIVAACSHVEPNPMEEYLVLAPAEPYVQSNKRIQAFIKLYDQLGDGSIDKQIAETYAEKIYFNDTLVTIHDRQNLSQYLKHTQQQLDSIKFQVLSVQDTGRDSYVRWLMQTKCKAMGQAIDIQSNGISHLRFNADSKIIVHQDYWDSMQGFYEHLPLIGGVLRWIKNGLYN